MLVVAAAAALGAVGLIFVVASYEPTSKAEEAAAGAAVDGQKGKLQPLAIDFPGLGSELSEKEVEREMSAYFH